VNIMATQPPTLDWISASIPKVGHRREENEDAIAAAPARFRFALADGATEGWESRDWAVSLATAYVRHPPTPADFPAWLGVAREQWRPTVPETPAAWYAAEKQQQGSYATLVGLELRTTQAPPGRWGWKALAIGDSCLLQVRDEALEVSFPLTARAEFGDRPALVPSASHVACPEPDWLAGFAAPGDLFLLASDAVASQLLDREGLTRALGAVRASLRDRDRIPIIDWMREVQSTVNDDVSLVAIRIPAERGAS
jgi:Protein phosphatase 2C